MNEDRLLIIEDKMSSVRNAEVNELIKKFESDIACAAACVKTWGKQN